MTAVTTSARPVRRLQIVAALIVAAFAAATEADSDRTRFIPIKDTAAAGLALDDPTGGLHTLANYRDQVVLVNFWATWCEPCVAEMASIRTLQQRLSGRPFAVLLVNYGEARTRVVDFVKREAVRSTVLLDPNQDASRAWRVRVLPASFLVGRDGRLRYSVVGELDWASDDAIAVVQDLLR